MKVRIPRQRILKEDFFFSVGSVVRCIRRLEELLRQMCCAAKAIGNSELEAKFTEGLILNLFEN
jgi:superfamily II RNA helicase